MTRKAVRKWLLLIAAGLALIQTALPAMAHEFWLDPSTYHPKVGAPVAISIRVGQFFKGNSYPFIREEFHRFVAVDARGETPVKGVDGDDPAVTMTFPRPGLVVLAHYSTQETLVFETWDKFEAYLKLEGLDHIADLHRRQGKPLSKITEVYSRCAKLLLDVGSGGGEDRAVGMPLELVAERNPYRLGAGEKLPVRLLYQGKPIAGVQITAISKADPTKRHNFRTDAAGRAEIAVPAAGPWLLNAVHMIAPAAGEKAHWSSLWASLNFDRP
jgi:uncharacterized GH25 family protein